jgi:hypothetical protein
MEGKRTYFYDEQQVKKTNDTFAQTVVHKYAMWCKRENSVFTPSGFALFLLEKGILRQRTIAKYMIVELYPRALYEEESKNKAVARLSDETGYSERHIKNILKDSPFYEANRNNW